MAKLTEVEREAIKAGMDLWVEGFQAEIQALMDKGKTPIFAKTWPELVKREILMKLKIQ
jgi:hypothetical protein